MEPVTVLMRDSAHVATLPGRSGWRVVKRPDTDLIEDALNILVLVAASDLSAVADFVREANRTHHLRALLVHADVDGVGQGIGGGVVEVVVAQVVHDLLQRKGFQGRIVGMTRYRCIVSADTKFAVVVGSGYIFGGYSDEDGLSGCAPRE